MELKRGRNIQEDDDLEPAVISTPSLRRAKPSVALAEEGIAEPPNRMIREPPVRK